MINQPSAYINPANQQGSIIKSGDKVKSDISSSFVGRISSGKAVFNSLVRPLPIKAFRDTNFNKPFFVKCYFFTIKGIPFLKHRKFLLFLVINGYLSKCSIKIKNSFLDSTRYCTPSFQWAYILPIPSVDSILLNIPSSFLCNIIENT